MEQALGQAVAGQVVALEPVQRLWSGCGEIVRVTLEGEGPERVIVKRIALPERLDHPRGWGGARSHARKLRSYRVELNWYRHWAGRCDAACRVPRALGTFELEGDRLLLVLEDLDLAGFTRRHSRAEEAQVRACLRWLAHFHARFMGEAPQGLWPTGTYWHLATRPDELEAMAPGPLKRAAGWIDQQLERCRFRTFVHGDAKIANFCFHPDGAVAAVDFQYVGGGCGMKDVAYFLGSCLSGPRCEAGEGQHLAYYFECLEEALGHYGKALDFDALEREWRDLYPLAWADFHRFLAGWMPDHQKIDDYMRRFTGEVLARFEQQEERA